MTSKTTYNTALTFVLDNCDIPADVRERLTALRESVNKRSTSERKPTANQRENEGYKTAILDYLMANPDLVMTVSDMLERIPALAGLTNQRVSALLRQLKETERVTKTTDKRRSYFGIAK